MHLDDVWLQTTLNTPNISGVWQIKKWSLVATFLFSLVLGFGGNVTASSDKSDQKLSGNDFIKSFSLHQLKKADNHDTLNASYANTKALVARLNALPFSI